MIRRWDKSKPPTGPFALNRDCAQAQGLVAWWPMGGASGKVFVPDLAGKHHLSPGTAPGGVTLGTDGRPALSFVAASSQYLTVGKAPVDAVPLTLTAWGKADSSIQTPIYIGGVANDNFFRIVLVSGKVRANCGTVTASAQANAITTASYTTGAWQLFGATFASTSSRTVYLNGGNSVNDTTSISPTAVNTRVFLGAGITISDAILQPWNGDLGEAGVWNVALSADMHARLYNEGTRFELWYPLRSRKWFSVAAAGGTATITAAAGTSTASTLAGSSIAASALTAAAGASTASAVAGASTAATAIASASGSATASTLAGAATTASAISAAAGASTASALAGASTAAAAITAAAGASTASTLIGVAGTGSTIGTAAGAATASALAGTSTAATALSSASGNSTASSLAGASTAAAAISAAAGTSTASTLVGSTVGNSSAISPAAGAASAQIIVGASFAAAAIGVAAGSATCNAMASSGGVVVLSASPIGHGPAMSSRPSNTGGRRPSQLNGRTR